MAIPGSAVQPVCADDHPHELLKYIQVFIGTAGRDEAADGVRSMGHFQSDYLLGDILQCLLPGGGDEPALTTDQRMRQPVRMGRDVVAKEPARAQIPIIPPGSIGRRHFDQLIVLCLNRDAAAVAAVGADRIRAFHHPWTKLVHGKAAGNGADRADLDAAPAELALKFMMAEMFDFSHRSPAGRGQGLHVHHLVAITHATQTLHATVHLGFDHRAEVFLLKDPLDLDEPAGGRCVLMGKVL